MNFESLGAGMIALPVGLFIVLAGVAALHFYWAFGGLWPAKSAADLARTVVGSNGKAGMPGRAMTVLVAVLIFAAGAWPLVHLSGMVPMALSKLGMWVLIAVFFGRGMVTYALPNMTAKMSEPFRSLNARYFSPLCLALGIGFLAIVLAV